MRPMWVVSRNSAAADASATATSLSSSRRSKYAAAAPAASGSPWSRISPRRRWFHLSRRRWHRSTLLVDGWQGYVPLHKTYDYRPTTVGDAKNASKLFPRVHRTFSNLKTWLKGTHHGVSSKHLPHYVNEFVFRFNRRRTPMAAFQSLLGLTAQHAPTTYKMLCTAESTG